MSIAEIQAGEARSHAESSSEYILKEFPDVATWENVSMRFIEPYVPVRIHMQAGYSQK